METRKSEWLALIKPILDRDEAKKDAKELARELGDILEINIDANPENLKQLSDEFNKQLSKMGKQPIVFSENTLQGIVNQFADAIANGFAKGADTGVAEALKRQLDGLRKQRQEIIAEQNKIEKNVHARSRMERLETFDIGAARPLKVEGDIGQEAQELVDGLYQSANQIEQAKKEYGKASAEYRNAVLDAQESYYKYLRMQKTMKLMPSAERSSISKDVRALYDVLGKDRDSYEIAGGMNIPFEENFAAEKILDAFEELSDAFESVSDNVMSLQKQLQLVDTEIDSITKKIREVGVADDTAFADAKDGLKTLQEIEAAYDRILKKRTARGGSKPIDDVVDALEYTPGDKAKLALSRNRYTEAVGSGSDWEEQYQWLVKFVKEYEAELARINASDDKTYKKNHLATIGKYTELYNKLKPLASGAEASLFEVAKKVGYQSDKVTGSVGAEKERPAKTASASADQGGKTNSDNIQTILGDMNAFLSSNEGKKTQDYFDAVATGAYEMSDDVKAAIEETIGSIDTLRSINIGANNHGGLIGEKSALILKKPLFNDDKQKFEVTDDQATAAIELQQRLGNTDVSDVNLGKIQEVIKLEEYLVELQNRVSGAPISTIGEKIEGINPDVLNATESSIQSLIQAMRDLYNIGVEVDVANLGNILYNGKSDQFGIVDMDVKHDFESFEEMLATFAQAVRNQVDDIADILNNPEMAQAWSRFADMVDGEIEKSKSSFSVVDRDAVVSAIGEEAQVQAELNEAKAEGEQISSVGDDDDVEVVQKENGSLEDKLELLRDIAEQYGSNITQKQRKRYEELNQKDMTEGLTPKEEDRYWELGEQIEEADSALEEFGKTYDRIIVKLANGNNVEILPDDKGLRTLAKIDEEYGEFYDGIEIEDVIYERIQKEATVAEQAVDSLNDSIEETKAVTQSVGNEVGTGTGDASSIDIESLRQQVEAKDAELDELRGQQNRELEAKNAEIAQIRETSEAQLEAVNHEKITLQNDLDLARQQAESAQDEAAASQAREAEIRQQLAEQERLNQQLRESLANVNTVGGDEQASVGSEELKNVLGSITYSVKIVHDDNDKQANKIAIDESTLENTLKRVFARGLNPQIEQADPEPKNEPWALEKTLQTVKSVLDTIQTNTAKPEAVEIAPAKTDIGNVLATENTLATIKTAVESINKKVIHGTKVSTSGGEQEPKQEPDKLTAYVANDDRDTASNKSNDKSMKLLADISLQRKNLEKFVVQLQTAGKLTDEYQVWIDNLTKFLDGITSTDDMTVWKKAFARTKTSVGIDDVVGRAEDKENGAAYKELIELQKTRNELELKHAKAQEGSAAKQFYAEQLAQMDQAIARQRVIIDNDEYELKLAKMQEAQARKLGEAEAQAADKDAKKQAANAKKMAQKQAMTGKAGNAISRAEGAWMNAISLGDDEHILPQEFEEKVNSLYNQLETLRLKQEEVRNTAAPVGKEQTQAFDKLKKKLNEQTILVNGLTDEIGGLVSEYQKLSGDNVTVIGKDTLDSDAGLDAYNQQLKQAVMTATNGKAQIKNFDAATGTLTYTVKTGAHEFTEYTAAVRHADGALVSVQGATKKTETFFEATARKMKELTSYFSGMAVFNFAKQELKRGIQYIREIDLALTELKKVTNETEQTYDKFLKTAAKTADKLGSTMKEVISSTADFSRVGYTLEQSATLAESALTLMNTSEYTDIGSASEALISALKAYGYAAEESMHVVDIFNEIGENYCRCA